MQPIFWVILLLHFVCGVLWAEDDDVQVVDFSSLMSKQSKVDSTSQIGIEPESSKLKSSEGTGAFLPLEMQTEEALPKSLKLKPQDTDPQVKNTPIETNSKDEFESVEFIENSKQVNTIQEPQKKEPKDLGRTIVEEVPLLDLNQIEFGATNKGDGVGEPTCELARIDLVDFSMVLGTPVDMVEDWCKKEHVNAYEVEVVIEAARSDYSGFNLRKLAYLAGWTSVFAISEPGLALLPSMTYGLYHFYRGEIEDEDKYPFYVKASYVNSHLNHIKTLELRTEEKSIVSQALNIDFQLVESQGFQAADSILRFKEILKPLHHNPRENTLPILGYGYLTVLTTTLIVSSFNSEMSTKGKIGFISVIGYGAVWSVQGLVRNFQEVFASVDGAKKDGLDFAKRNYRVEPLMKNKMKAQ